MYLLMGECEAKLFSTFARPLVSKAPCKIRSIYRVPANTRPSLFVHSVPPQRVSGPRRARQRQALWGEPAAGQLHLLPVRGGLRQDPRLADRLLHPEGRQRGVGQRRAPLRRYWARPRPRFLVLPWCVIRRLMPASLQSRLAVVDGDAGSWRMRQHGAGR